MLSFGPPSAISLGLAVEWRVKGQLRCVRLDLSVDWKVYAGREIMLIGELARRAGVKPQTVRYYESLGVLSRAERTASGYRRYGSRAVEELGFIHKAQSLGFSLDEIRQILDLGRSGRAPCASVLAIAEAHLATLEQRMSQLAQLREQLSEAIRGWKDGGVPTECASTLCGLINQAGNSPAASVRRHVIRPRRLAGS